MGGDFAVQSHSMGGVRGSAEGHTHTHREEKTHTHTHTHTQERTVGPTIITLHEFIVPGLIIELHYICSVRLN